MSISTLPSRMSHAPSNRPPMCRRPPSSRRHIAVERPSCSSIRGNIGREIDCPTGRYPVEDLRLEHVDAVLIVSLTRRPTRLLENRSIRPSAPRMTMPNSRGSPPLPTRASRPHLVSRGTRPAPLGPHRSPRPRDDEETVAELVDRVQHRSGCPERCLLCRVDEADTELRPVPK